MKAFEPPFRKVAVPSRCMVRSGAAGAGAQIVTPAMKQKVEAAGRRADRRPTVELKGSRRESDVVRGKQTPLEHRQHVHHRTSRLGRSARAELSSAGGRSNLFPTSLAAPSTTRARVDGIAWVEMFSDTHSGRVLQRITLRGHRAKGFALAAAARTTVRRRLSESDVRGVSFYV